ncbi:MAG TPA: TolC family protein [Candidatus Baltobacteraceae bacterium]|nr:TolC family protein [Candidatus Baltobacteraceae bacterium]
MLAGASTFLLAAMCTSAPRAATMTLQDAVSYALDHSPVVAQKRTALAQAHSALAKARGNAYPLVNGQLQNVSQKSSNYGGVYQIIGAATQQVFSQNTAQIGTQYTLQTGGLSFLQLASARAAEAQAREDLTGAEDQLATSVTTAYFTVVQRQAIVVLDESDLKYQNVLVGVAKAKEQAGMAAGVDVLKAQVAQAKSAAALVGARADVENGIDQLVQSIGAPLDVAFVFPKDIANPALPTEPEPNLETVAVKSRPDVESARDSLAAAQFTRKGWGRELYPQVQLTAGFGNQLAPTNVTFLTNPDGTPVLGPGGVPVAAPRTGSPGFWTLGATSTFTLPFVDYGARQTERESDDAAVASSQNALDQATTQVRVDVRTSYRSAQSALSQLTFVRDEARLGTESARVAELQYRHGLISLSDVLQTQQQSISAQSDFVNARVAYVDAVVKLRVSLGIYDARSAVADLR